MSWFQKQRQDFIRATLMTYGMIRRKQIVEKFDVTLAIASADIQTFIDAHPDLIEYDRYAKCYAFDGSDLLDEKPCSA